MYIYTRYSNSFSVFLFVKILSGNLEDYIFRLPVPKKETPVTFFYIFK